MSPCTIFLRSTDPQPAIPGVLHRAQKFGTEVHTLVRQAPRDEFSRIILGAHNFVRSGKCGTDAARQRVLDFILDATLLVGVGQTPPEGERYSVSVVATIGGTSDMMVFDGLTLRDSTGSDLLA